MNKETLDIFNQYLGGGKNVIMAKARRTGASVRQTPVVKRPRGLSITDSIIAWKILYDKYDRRRLRMESIKRIFNI